MRRFALLLAVVLPLAAAAQAPAPEWTPPPADPPPEAGRDSGAPDLGGIEQGVGSFLENLLRDVQPQMEDMARSLDRTFDRFAPVFDDLASLMDDIGNYQAPERLPNGDILIRRRPDAPPAPPIGNALRDLTRPSPEASPRDEAVPDAPVIPTPTAPPVEL